VSANPAPIPPPPPPSWGGAPVSLSGTPSRGGFLGGRSRLLLSLALVVVLTGGSLFYLFSRSGHGGETAQALSLALAKGDVHHYRMTIDLQGSLGAGGAKAPFDMAMSGTLLWRVDDVDAKGIAHVYVSLQSGSLTVNGQSGTLGDDHMTLRIAPDGRILSGCTFGGPGAGYIASIGIPGASELTPVLPDAAVMPGATWSKSFVQRFPSAAGGVHFATTSTFVRTEDVAGVSAAVVRTSGKARLNTTVDLKKLAAEYGFPSGLSKGEDPRFHYAGSIQLATTSWIDPASRQLVRESVGSQFDVTLTGIALPADDRIPGGKVRFAGTETVKLNRVN